MNGEGTQGLHHCPSLY